MGLSYEAAEQALPRAVWYFGPLLYIVSALRPLSRHYHARRRSRRCTRRRVSAIRPLSRHNHQQSDQREHQDSSKSQLCVR